MLHLRLFRLAITDHRPFYFFGAVIMDTQAILHGRNHCRPPRLAKLQGRTGITGHKHIFHRRDLWTVKLDHFINPIEDLIQAMGRPDSRDWFPVQRELLNHFGYWTTESSEHCAEYLPYFMPREASRASVKIDLHKTSPDVPRTAARWGKESKLVMQTDGRKPLDIVRSPEYGLHIIHALETDNVYRMHINVINNGAITNLPNDYCVEVPCVADRTGIHPTFIGALPVHLAALCRSMADMQTLASEAALHRDLTMAYRACLIDPLTAASATPASIGECFTKLLAAERPWLEPYWNDALASFQQ